MTEQDVELAVSTPTMEEELTEPHQNFSLWSLCGVGLMTGSTWTALGGSIVVALYNGGPPGVIYEFIAVSIFYWMIAACIAELASAIPSSAGVYHWAAVTGGQRFGRLCSWYTGWFNALAWTFGAASMSAILANQIIAMYQLFHPGYSSERWHIFVVYLALTWISCSIVLFGNRALPFVGDIGAALVILGVIVTVIVCAVMPSQNGTPYASNEFVWEDWLNLAGYTSNGFVFCAGMLNGAYAVGTPDCVTHLAEEIPQPRKNIPKAIAVQMGIGFITAIVFLIAIFYAVNDSDELLSTGATFPLSIIYAQATGTKAGTLGLSLVIIIPTFCTSIGTYITSGRVVWTLARDNAAPLSAYTGQIHPRWENPFYSTLGCGLVSTVMGCIYLGSTTAFNAFVGSFVVLLTLSYLGAILPYLLSGRANVLPGWFHMPKKVFIPLATVACLYMIAFDIIFCFPYYLPVSAEDMNYTSVIVVGLVLITTIMWLLKGRKVYKGPDATLLQRIQGIDVPVGEGESLDQVKG